MIKPALAWLGLPWSAAPTQPPLAAAPQAETFDAAYAMEATCHAPTLEQVRAELAGLGVPRRRVASQCTPSNLPAAAMHAEGWMC